MVLLTRYVSQQFKLFVCWTWNFAKSFECQPRVKNIESCVVERNRDSEKGSICSISSDPRREKGAISTVLPYGEYHLEKSCGHLNIWNSLSYIFIHSFIHSFIYLFIHSFFHSFITLF